MSKKNVAEMNELITTQKTQVDSLHANTKNLTKNILTEVDQKIEQSNQDVYTKAEVDQLIRQIRQEAEHKSLKDQASRNRLNLILTGLPEDEAKSTYDLTKDFISNALKIKGVKIDTAYRLGQPMEAGSSFARPVVVRFGFVSDRNLVWRKRVDITQDESGMQTFPKSLETISRSSIE